MTMGVSRGARGGASGGLIDLISAAPGWVGASASCRAASAKFIGEKTIICCVVGEYVLPACWGVVVRARVAFAAEVLGLLAVFAPVVWNTPKVTAGRIMIAINASLWTFVSLFRLLEGILPCAAFGRDKKSINEAKALTIPLDSLIGILPTCSSRISDS